MIQQCQVHQIFIFIYFIATQKKKIILEKKKKVKSQIFICNISIIIIINLICQKQELVRPVQQKINLPLPYEGGESFKV